MLRNFLKNRKAQNTAEYALLIALVVAGVIAMQTYAQRALQARVHDASYYLATAASDNAVGLGSNVQYEPYYLQSNYDSNSQSNETKILNAATNEVGQEDFSNRQREGIQNTTYNAQDKTGQ